MYFLIDNKNLIIFGWSAKCIVLILNLFIISFKHVIPILQIHGNTYNILSNDILNSIENYTTIIFCRNPYKDLYLILDKNEWIIQTYVAR